MGDVVVMGTLSRTLFAHFNGNACRICKGRRFADANLDFARFSERLQQPVGNVVRERFEQIHMAAGALFDNHIVQRAVVKHTVDVLVVNGLMDIDFDFSVNVDRLGSRPFVFEDPDAGVKGDARKNNASSGHVASVKVNQPVL
jgi:hypothetical protein